MLIGRKAFDGSSAAAIVAAILDTQPASISTVQPLTPPALDHVIKTCLAKDPDERWQSAGDVARELRWIAESGAHAPSIVAPAALRWNRRSVLMVAVVGLLAGGIGGAAAIWNTTRARPATPPLRVTRAIVPLPASASLQFAATSSLALSPDGTRLAYVMARGGGSQIYLRSLDEFDAKPIAGTEGAYSPFFSPDSRWLAFSSAGKLKKVAVSGGAPQTICDAEGAYGGTWGPDDTIVMASTWRVGLSKCAASGGAPQVLTTLDEGKQEKSHRFPQFLPGGRAVVFNIVSADSKSFDDARIAALSLDTGQIRVLLEGGTNPRFVSTGHLVYVRGASLMAVPFDPRRLEITGQSAPVLDGVSTTAEHGFAHFSVAQSGLLAYVRGDVRGSDRRVVWVDRQGRIDPVMDAHGAFDRLRLSPDGQRLALDIAGSNDQVWLYDLARRTLTPLTFAWDNQVVTWTPDGKRIVFRSDRAGHYNFYSQVPDGSGSVERLTERPYHQGGGSWLPDGRVFAFHEEHSMAGPDNVWLLTVEPTRTVRPLMQTPFSEGDPRFSPDGHWLAYVSNQSGRPEVYVQPFPGLNTKWRISTDGGNAPMWEPHGRELFYQNGDKLMAVGIETAPRFAAGTPRLLFEGSYVVQTEDDYDVAPDGRRFVMIQRGPSEAPATQITLVQNWFEELKRRVPTR